MTNVMTHKTMRQRIVGYIGEHNGASAAEISHALDITAANIRYHLSILEEDGRIQVLGLRKDQGRGRPIQVFGLSENSMGDNLPLLLDQLLGILIRRKQDIDFDSILTELAEKLFPETIKIPENHFSKRLINLISKLNKYGYKARWEAHIDAPRIIFDHCPYRSVINGHSELCLLDTLILSKQLNSKVAHTAFLEKNSRGTSFCQFIINS